MKRIFLILLITLIVANKLAIAEKTAPERVIDSLIQVLSTAKEDTNKVMQFLHLAANHRSIDLKKSIAYGDKALALAKKLKHRNSISECYYFIGNSYLLQSNDSAALRYLSMCLALEKEKGDPEGIAAVCTNIGNIFLNLSNYTKALDYYLQGVKLFERNGNIYGEANCLNNISNVFIMQNEYAKAIDYYRKALALYTKLNKKEGIALGYGNIGSTYSSANQYDSAKFYLSKSLQLYREINDSEGIQRDLANFAMLYLKQKKYAAAFENNVLAIQIAKQQNYVDELGQDFITQSAIYLNLAKDSSFKRTADITKYLPSQNVLLLAKSYCDSAIKNLLLMGNLEALSNAYQQLSEIEKLRKNYKEALEAHQLFKQLHDSIFSIEKDKKITQRAMQYEFDKKEALAKSEQEKKDIRQRNIRNSILAGLIGALVFLLVVYKQRNQIKEGKRLSDELLLNILPSEVADELKQKGSAEAKLIDEVTVLFTDFKGFTTMSEKLSPKALVQDIHECFSAFDRIMEKHGMEKIKTIGDAYMAAGGLPVPNKTHAADAINAALEICKFINEGKAAKIAKGAPYFEIRVGVHTGPVVAGIVGVKKFAYDIWGDTVNTASRMESSGEVGKVNISGSTYELVKNKFTCEYRGKIAAKNKGEIDMYFVQVADDREREF